MRRVWARMAGLVSLVVALTATSAGIASGAGITNSGSDLRDGWYGNQPRLAPDAVSAATFGQMWKGDVDGQVYAQPLVSGSNVIVATERNKVYALDAETGTPRWTVDLGAPFPAALVGPFGCFDLQPDLGVTSTPVIDTATNTIYLTHKTYAPGSTTKAAYYLDALDASTGATRAGFPVRFEGKAQNATRDVNFETTTEMQRPGLLLMDGVVYAGFGGHCDIAPYQGWVFGVSATTGAVRARWTAVANGDDGAGIWQSGSGLMSDGPGRIFVSTGNGGSPTSPQAAPGNGQYGESIVRLDVQPDGTLKAKDFFAPSDAALLDEYDADFASAGLTALRDSTFGTAKHPHVAVAVGKAGYVYLLNRDDLGGFQQAPGNGERVIERIGPYGGVWSRPGVWPGDGGWIAIPAASSWWDGVPGASAWSSGPLNVYRYRVSDGEPSLDAPVSSDDAFGFGSGAPVITSEGTASGSAVLWIVWAADSSGTNAQLRAYDPVPVNGHLRLRRSWPIGQSSKFSMPGIGNGRLYVGTRDGHVVAFGAPVKAEVQAASTTFPTTTLGATSTANVKLTFAGNVHVNAVSAKAAGTFTARPGAGVVGGDFHDGQTVTVPVDFTPKAPGIAGGTLDVATDQGAFSFTLTGTGQASEPLLTAAPPVVSFGGAVVGQQRAGTVTLGNAGGQSLKITGVELPDAPFNVPKPPKVGDVIAGGEALNVSVAYAPTAVGDFNDDLVVHTTGGDETIGLSGSAGLGPRLELTPASGWAFGDVVVGQSATATVDVANLGDSAMTVTKSKPPVSSVLEIVAGLDEGATLAPGEHRAVTMRFTPAATGPVTSAWTLNAADGSGVHLIPVTGTGVAAPVVDPPGPDPDPGTPPVVLAPTPTPAPPAAGVLGAQGPVLPARVRPELVLTRLTPSRDGHTLAVRGRVAKAAVGPVSVRLAARVGRKTVVVATTARLRGRSTFAVTVALPRSVRGWSRIEATVRFAGTARVWPGATSKVLVRVRAR